MGLLLRVWVQIFSKAFLGEIQSSSREDPHTSSATRTPTVACLLAYSSVSVAWAWAPFAARRSQRSFGYEYEPKGARNRPSTFPGVPRASVWEGCTHGRAYP